MAKIKFSGKSHRREVLKQIVERYLHKRIEESRCEDSENLKDIKVTQELIWQKLGKHIDGFPRSPFTLTPARRRAVVQVWCELPSYMNSTADVCSKDAFSGASQCNLLDFRNTAHQLSYFLFYFVLVERWGHSTLVLFWAWALFQLHQDTKVLLLSTTIRIIATIQVHLYPLFSLLKANNNFLFAAVTERWELPANSRKCACTTVCTTKMMCTTY